MLCEGDQGQPGTWLWISVSDVDALYAELEQRRARLRHPRRTILGDLASVRSLTRMDMFFASEPMSSRANLPGPSVMGTDISGSPTRLEIGDAPSEPLVPGAAPALCGRYRQLTRGRQSGS